MQAPQEQVISAGRPRHKPNGQMREVVKSAAERLPVAQATLVERCEAGRDVIHMAPKLDGAAALEHWAISPGREAGAAVLDSDAVAVVHDQRHAPPVTTATAAEATDVRDRIVAPDMTGNKPGTVPRH